MQGTTRLTHPEYGRMEIKRNPRARHIIMRVRDGVIYISMPLTATEKELSQALNRYGNELKAVKLKQSYTPYSFGYRIEATHFSFEIKEHTEENFKIRYNKKEATFFCPADTNFNKHETRVLIKKVIKNAMHRRAKEVLPVRLGELALKNGFRYNKVTLRDARTRWGSYCCNTGNISLNINLILMDDEAIDYVLLHELCHSIEPNHSRRFWELLDKVMKKGSKTVRRKLKEKNIEL